MPDKPWKVFERQIAGIFGTTRMLMKGTDEVSDIGGDDPDFPLVLDCKLRKRGNWRVAQWFLKLEEATLDSSRWPVLVLREPGKVRKYAVVRRSDIVNLMIQETTINPDAIFIRQMEPARKLSLLGQWDQLMKDVQAQRRKRCVLKLMPVLMISDSKHDLELALLTPEDLAWVLREGGILKNGSDTQTHKSGREAGILTLERC